ncbi:putative 6-hydroxy-D-nicotine oxidase [Glarea lozoyensis 74030]|uniref:Putative 6-hydroxy-D-nicotine oxidase n=1 Tax=Glarea lozoyensis (strain ATCC 74030 / MF5533) TaxID=1104152 RepID=H0EV91_GLAL7|nr:putative 6-hydroxy-D-nicotine oxidase [Glarea lozoyensis 74030]
MENFNEIEVDQTTFIAKIGAGQRLGNVALGIHEQGKRGLPHGTCPGVGIGGHATHGGYGYDSRLWGLALDTIFGLDVVFANGSIIYANETQNPDVYFAMRGAGDSFGIVTNFYMQTNEAPETVTYFTANLNETLKSIDQLTSAFLRTQDFVINSPLLTKNISFGFYTDNSGALSITGMCADPLAEPLDGYNIHDTFYAKSVVTKEAEPLTEEAANYE